VLLAGTPVDALAEQVGVPVVAGVLLDHVHQQRDPAVTAGSATAPSCSTTDRLRRCRPSLREPSFRGWEMAW
jgi:hypothetical protein